MPRTDHYPAPSRARIDHDLAHDLNAKCRQARDRVAGLDGRQRLARGVADLCERRLGKPRFEAPLIMGCGLLLMSLDIARWYSWHGMAVVPGEGWWAGFLERLDAFRRAGGMANGLGGCLPGLLPCGLGGWLLFAEDAEPS